MGFGIFENYRQKKPQTVIRDGIVGILAGAIIAVPVLGVLPALAIVLLGSSIWTVAARVVATDNKESGSKDKISAGSTNHGLSAEDTLANDVNEKSEMLFSETVRLQKEKEKANTQLAR